MKKSRKTNFKIEYILLYGIYFAISVFFVFCKRSSISELENRNLMKFPNDITINKILSGDYFKEIDTWFADTVPFRDTILSMSYNLKRVKGLTTKIDFTNYTFKDNYNEEINIATKSDVENEDIKAILQIDDNKTSEVETFETKYDIEANETQTSEIEENTEESTNESTDESTNKDDYYKENNLIIFEDDGGLRAVEDFSGYRKGDESYAQAVNLYKEVMPFTNIYTMILPTAIAYYYPEELSSTIASQKKCIDNISSFLDSRIVKVDVYDTLLEHKNENIYLRADHHWSPLGAYYAALAFSSAANVDFKSLADSYETHKINRYRGSLYKLTGNERLKDTYEPFEFFVPLNINYTVEQFTYILDKKGNAVAKGAYMNSPKLFDMSETKRATGYSVYLGSDNMTTIVTMPDNKTNRKLLILKDSFGNPIPSFLLYSFDSIHIVDYRYFVDNIVAYVVDNDITDILFVNNIQNVIRDRAASKYRNFLTQGLNFDE